MLATTEIFSKKVLAEAAFTKGTSVAT